jgi:hypothetical protein
MKPLPQKPNTTRSGAIACCFGTLWEEHFKGGKGCLWCAAHVSEEGK